MEDNPEAAIPTPACCEWYTGFGGDNGLAFIVELMLFIFPPVYTGGFAFAFTLLLLVPAVEAAPDVVFEPEPPEFRLRSGGCCWDEIIFPSFSPVVPACPIAVGLPLPGGFELLLLLLGVLLLRLPAAPVISTPAPVAPSCRPCPMPLLDGENTVLPP